MENKPFQVSPPPNEIANVTTDSQFVQMRQPVPSVLPPYDEFSTQMSPFGDERWDLDIEENKRRKQIHREYVYNYRKTMQQQQPPPPTREQPANMMQEPQPPVGSPPQIIVEAAGDYEPPILEADPNKKDYFKREPAIMKPKPLSELKFDVPNPPNLYPVLKFPERKFKSEYEFPQSINHFDKTGVCHYGVHVPFWQFSNKQT